MNAAALSEPPHFSVVASGLFVAGGIVCLVFALLCVLLLLTVFLIARLVLVLSLVLALIPVLILIVHFDLLEICFVPYVYKLIFPPRAAFYSNRLLTVFLPLKNLQTVDTD